MPEFWGYPSRRMITILLIHIGSQVKTRQSQSYKLKEFAKTTIFFNFVKWIWQVLLKIQSGHDSVHSWTDGRTDKVKPVYPSFNFVEARGIITLDALCICMRDQILALVRGWKCLHYIRNHFPFHNLKSLAKLKTAVTPLLTHWSYCSLALSCQNEVWVAADWDQPGTM